MKNVFIALGKAICYTLLFAAMQLIAGFIVALAMGIGYAVEQLTLNGGLDYNTLMTVLYDGVTTNATLITLVSNICTVGVLFAFFALRKKNLLSEINASPIPALTYVPLSIIGMCFAVLITFALGILPISEEVWEEYNQSASMIDSAGAYTDALHRYIRTHSRGDRVSRTCIHAAQARHARMGCGNIAGGCFRRAAWADIMGCICVRHGACAGGDS